MNTACSRTKIVFSWSGGKDSTLALTQLLKGGMHTIVALLTSVSQDYDRITMHGVRSCLLEAQAESLGLPLEKISLKKSTTNEEYETKMKEKLLLYRNQGIDMVGFGDIFLEDLRRYREENLSKLNMKGIFPLWKKDTAKLIQEFLDAGFRAVITCVDAKFLDKSFAGRVIDSTFLADLPGSVDPCGENGEFHSFVFAGPIFRKKISYKKGEVVLREGRFYYCDLLPV
jgi:uncharacterized protein (TIGR00290 family)